MLAIVSQVLYDVQQVKRKIFGAVNDEQKKKRPGGQPGRQGYQQEMVGNCIHQRD